MLRSFAKINLFLHITGKRADGYHLLESLFAKLQIHDTVTAENYEYLLCECSNKSIKEPNIVIKAAQALRDFSNVKLGAKININKKIPIGAGLGGGSANAATVLRMLNNLWQLKLNKDELMEIGLTIGADIPFCLQENAAFVQGIGEKITPFMLLNKKIDVILVNPGYQILAVDAYKKVKSFSAPITKEVIFEQIFTGKNDLEDAALEICPELQEVRKALSNQKPQLVRMSGSGPTYFMIFNDPKALQIAKINLIRDYPQWQIWQDQILI